MYQGKTATQHLKYKDETPTVMVHAGQINENTTLYIPTDEIIHARSVWGRLGTLLQQERERTHSIGKFIQGVVAGDSIAWFGIVGHFGINGKEDRGDAHRVPANDHGEESEVIRRWDTGDARGRRHTRGSGNSVS